MPTLRFDPWPLFECSGSVLVSPYDDGVDRHGPVDVVESIRRHEQGCEDLLPGSVDGPPDQALVDGPERTEFVGNVPPHQRLDPVPHRIGDH